MKKTILLPVLLLGLTMASCGSNSKAGTKEQFKDMSYGEALQDDEAQQVKARACAALRDVSSAEIETNEYEISDNEKVEAKQTSKVKISTEGYVRGEGKEEIKQTIQGLSFTEKHEQQMSMAFASKDEAYYMVQGLVEDGIETLNLTALPSAAYAAALAEEMSATLLTGYVAGLQAAKVFKVKKGYEAALTQIVETHTAVEWDQGYKEYVSIQKNEVKFVMNDKYQITEFTSVEELHTNRDAVTGAWYDKVIVVGQETTKGKAKYDAKSSDAGLSAELVAKGANSMLVDQVAVTLVAAKAEGETITPVGTQPLTPAYEIVTGINSRSVGVVVELSNSAAANAFALAASAAVKDDVFTAAEVDTSAVPVTYPNNNITNKEFEFGGVNLNFAVLNENVAVTRALIEFDVTSSPAATALAISNIQVTVY